MTTAAEARAQWCPMVRIARDESIVIETAKVGDIVAITEQRHIVAGCNRDALSGANRGEHGQHRPLNSCLCIADKCAMWRWERNVEVTDRPPKFWSLSRHSTVVTRYLKPTDGYCGLAGRQEFLR